ncbi:MAG: hypothetical protein IKU39_05975 [Lachnospiraceae bacterium]|nr:hypothetical protein [Lachnospiraceae bacterium]
MKKCENCIQSFSAELKRPDKIFLGFSYDDAEKKFVRVYYDGLYAPSAEPCLAEEVEEHRFMDPSILHVLKRERRPIVNAYIYANEYDTFIEMSALDHFDLRHASFLLHSVQGEYAYAIAVVENALQILYENPEIAF